MDFYIPETKTIIEVDGPSHYIAPSRELNQTSESRIRILKRKGYKVIQVPYFINEPRMESEEGSIRLEDLLSEI